MYKDFGTRTILYRFIFAYILILILLLNLIYGHLIPIKQKLFKKTKIGINCSAETRQKISECCKRIFKIE